MRPPIRPRSHKPQAPHDIPAPTRTTGRRRRAPGSADRPAPPPSQTTAVQGRPVLVVEDEPLVLKLIAERLQAEGYRVTAVADGKRAWEHFKEECPDLAIVDLMLPGMNGWRLCQKLRTDPRYQRVRIIMLSALIDDNSKAGALDQCDFLMAKPVNVEALMQKVRELLG